jgi:hypothetical protein
MSTDMELEVCSGSRNKNIITFVMLAKDLGNPLVMTIKREQKAPNAIISISICHHSAS